MFIAELCVRLRRKGVVLRQTRFLGQLLCGWFQSSTYSSTSSSDTERRVVIVEHYTTQIHNTAQPLQPSPRPTTPHCSSTPDQHTTLRADPSDCHCTIPAPRAATATQPPPLSIPPPLPEHRVELNNKTSVDFCTPGYYTPRTVDIIELFWCNDILFIGHRRMKTVEHRSIGILANPGVWGMLYSGDLLMPLGVLELKERWGN